MKVLSPTATGTKTSICTELLEPAYLPYSHRYERRVYGCGLDVSLTSPGVAVRVKGPTVPEALSFCFFNSGVPVVLLRYFRGRFLWPSLVGDAVGYRHGARNLAM
jgi:hypothetical protein